MENITSELKISELKQGSLFKAYEELHSQASSILMFSLQWRDLEAHFGSTRKLIETGLEQLIEREKDLISREKELEAKGSELNSNLALKETQLGGIERLIEELSKLLESNKQHVDSLESLIQENREELHVKERQYAEIQRLIGEKEREFDHIKCCIKEGEERFEYVKGCIKEGEEKLEVLEKRVKQKSEEAESKAKEVDSIRRTLRGYKDDIELKDRQFNGIRRSLEERKKEIELREEQLRVCRSSINDCDREIKVKEKKLNSIQNSIAECSNELESKERRLDLLKKDVELKEKNLVWLCRMVDQCAQKFEVKEREFEAFLGKLELREKFCESKFGELGVLEKKVNDWLKEVETREKNLVVLQNLVNERYEEVEKKETEFEKRIGEFKLSENELALSQKSTELRAKEKTISLHSQVKIEQSEDTHINNAIVPLTTNSQYFIPMEGKDLQLLLNGHLKRHDLLCSEISSVLQASLDAAKLVLDAMQGFYPSNSSTEATETFDVNIVRRSCILLLEQLMQASPQISSQVRDEALKLAVDWKAKMIVANENFLEVLGFLQFLASYRLASAFDPNELRILFDIVGHHRQASELRQFLCPPDKTPVKIERVEDSLDKVVPSSSNLQLSTLQNNILAHLQTSADAKFVLDFIQGSISEHWKRGVVGFEASVMISYISVFEQLFRISPQLQPLVKEEAKKLAVEWKAKMRTNTEYSLEVLGFLQFLATYGLISSFNENEILKFLETISQQKQALELCCNLGFAEKIPEFIQNLIQRKKVIDAVRLICSFKLTDKFSLVPLLTKYVEDLKDFTQKSCKGKKPIEEKEKVTDEEITALRTVIQCIKDYNLESKFHSVPISKRITLLEHIKKQRRRSAELVRPKIEWRQKPLKQEQKPSVPTKGEQQHQQPWKKRRNDIIAHHHSPPHGRHKFPRTSTSTVRPRGSPVFIPIVPSGPSPLEFSANLHEAAMGFAGNPRQFGLAAVSDNILSPNVGVDPFVRTPKHEINNS
ncbi:Frigida-like [Trema orientale]|uniref:FRIGIDA-like protein n=1 Tax=Trema orientale TaxID=63057 RepID=A0A2P5CQ28_TREOI|nr:Frigida-like [Trema orientale]